PLAGQRNRPRPARGSLPAEVLQSRRDRAPRLSTGPALPRVARLRPPDRRRDGLDVVLRRRRTWHNRPRLLNLLTDGRMTCGSCGQGAAGAGLGTLTRRRAPSCGRRVGQIFASRLFISPISAVWLVLMLVASRLAGGCLPSRSSAVAIVTAPRWWAIIMVRNIRSKACPVAAASRAMSSLLIIIPSIVEPRGIDGLAAIGIPLIPLPPPIGIPEGMGMEDAPPVVIPLIMCAVGRAAGSCQRSSQLVMTVISGPCAFSIWVSSCLTWGEEALVAARRAISIACRWCAIMCCTKVT